jgi:excisionase family DNA binding protein
MPEKFYTIAEVCELLNVSRPTVNRWLATGKLRSIKLDRARRIPASAIQELVDAGAAKARATLQHDESDTSASEQGYQDMKAHSPDLEGGNADA